MYTSADSMLAYIHSKKQIQGKPFNGEQFLHRLDVLDVISFLRSVHEILPDKPAAFLFAWNNVSSLDTLYLQVRPLTGVWHPLTAMLRMRWQLHAGCPFSGPTMLTRF